MTQIIHIGRAPTAFLARFPGASGDYASTPDNAAFSPLGDFSVVALLSLDDWTPGAVMDIAAQNHTTGNQRSWRFSVATTGALALTVSTAGTGASTTTHTGGTSAGFTNATSHWALVTRATGSGDIKFYTATDEPWKVTQPPIGSFSQLGSTISAATGTLFDSTGALQVASSNTTGSPLDGDIRRVSLYTGIYGSGSETLVRDFCPSDAGATTPTSWVSATTGETWTLNGGVTLHVA